MRDRSDYQDSWSRVNTYQEVNFMGIYTSLYQGASGMNANSMAINIAGNNISNMNTVGFKTSRGNFEDILSNSMLGQTTGGGTMLGSVSQQFEQGDMQQTGNALDMAISGNGFFVLKGTGQNANRDFYSRAGNFSINAEGSLVSSSGLLVQGYGADSAGKIGSSIGDIQIAGKNMPPEASKNLNMRLNLDSSEKYDPKSGKQTTFTTTATVYDSQGNSHEVELTMKRGVDTTKNEYTNNWDYTVKVDGQDVVSATGQLQFDADGKMLVSSSTIKDIDFSPSGASPMKISLNFGDETSVSTQGNYGNGSSVTSQVVDGRAGGELLGVNVAADGTVQGTYSNGETQILGQVALAHFTNMNGLNSVGQNLFESTNQAGTVSVGSCGSGGRGMIQSGALEQSNVDLSREFINLITAQRGFQASSRTISTADQMINEAIRIKQ
jgi:flagellar hook protein FlgE